MCRRGVIAVLFGKAALAMIAKPEDNSFGGF
jgi:hypothetical protein